MKLMSANLINAIYNCRTTHLIYEKNTSTTTN